MIPPDGWRVPVEGGVAHFFEALDARTGRVRTLCGKMRRQTAYLHPFAGVEGEWRPCRTCWRRRPDPPELDREAAPSPNPTPDGEV